MGLSCPRFYGMPALKTTKPPFHKKGGFARKSILSEHYSEQGNPNEESKINKSEVPTMLSKFKSPKQAGE